MDDVSSKELLNSYTSKVLPISYSAAKNTLKICNVIQEQGKPIEIHDRINEEADNSKYKMSNLTGLNFLPGSKLEAKDFNEKWYSARVVETDWIEREVLIHFDKWSSRFDEWIPMDSSRLRMLQINSKELKRKEFSIGERILATWIDGRKYPAKVNSTLDNDKYDVLFDDGYSKTLKSSKMTKLLEISGKKVEEENTYNTYLGSKQERRDKKRKHTITELFHHHSKKRIKNDTEKTVNKQHIVDLQNIKYVSKLESVSRLIKDEVDSRNDIYKSLEYPNKIRKIKKENRKYNTDSGKNLNNLIDKNCQEYGLTDFQDDYTTYIGNLRVEIEDSTYKCPKNGCTKNFRKENLLTMHIKHYHPEYSKFLGSTPNVADLAYARTIGEPVDYLIPKKSRLAISHIAHVEQESIPSVYHVIKTDFNHAKIDNKYENNSISLDSNLLQESNNCTMSPGTLFDMHFKEVKHHIGIKTLPPIRHLSSIGINNSEQLQGLKTVNHVQKPIVINSKEKLNKKRHQYYNRLNKMEKYTRNTECEENYKFVDKLLNRDLTFNLNHKRQNTSNNKPEILNKIEQCKGDGVIIENSELIKVEKLRREEIINCTCGIIEEDGLMIQCDLCLCWQHGHCNGIEKETDVPEKYICYICQNAYRQRLSKKYFYDQDWIREGKLPTIYNYTIYSIDKHERAAKLKRSCDLIAVLLQIKNLIHSLRVKLNISQNKDHPKLYLWAKNWKKIIFPTIKIQPVAIMQIIKHNNCSNDYETDRSDKTEISFSTKNICDQKLITSDTELMKILEEDNIQVEETKLLRKYPSLNNFKDAGRILLDALTKNGCEDKSSHTLLFNNVVDKNDHQIKKKCVPKNVNLEIFHKSELISSKLPIDCNTLQLPIDGKVLHSIVPEPEAAIDPIECKLRLLEHIDNFQNYIDYTLAFAELQLTVLEDSNNLEKQNSDQHIQSKQIIHMILKDLETIRKLSVLC